MNNLQKNIIIAVLFAVLIASLFLSESSIIHAVIALIVFAVTIVLNTQKSSAGSSNINQKR